VPKIQQPQSDLVVQPNLPDAPFLPDAPSSGAAAQLEFVTNFLRRRYRIVLIGLLLSLPFAALYLFLAPATYTATATIMIEPRKSPLSQTLGGDPPTDAAWIESQIGILRSQNVAAYVVKQLRLTEDPAFIRSGDGLLEELLAGLDKLLTRLGWQAPEPKSEAERTAETIAAFMEQLTVKRLGPTYLMRVDFRSRNREQATKIANAMIDAYVYDQLSAKYQANRRTGDWLQERLQMLREQAAAAERAAIEFRAKNNIVAAGNALLDDKQLADLHEQLSAARTRTAELQTRLGRIEAVRGAYQQDQPTSEADETVSEAMSNSIIQKLRGNYLDLVSREADFSARYGKNHASVVNLRRQIRDIRRNIRDELGRIAETFKSELEIATKRQGELEKEVASLASKNSDMNQTAVALFSLNAAAQSYRKIYDNFLQQHTVSVQQQTYPVTEARQTSAASAIKTGPKAVLVWPITLLAGGLLGVGLGALREIMDRRFRTREQIRSVLATDCLALVPLQTEGRRRMFSGRQVLAAQTTRAISAHPIGPRSVFFAPKIMRAMIDSPSSPYAEAIRSIKLTVDLSSEEKCCKVIGFTSCLASEGKSTLSASIAALTAQSGARVILLDCDLRHPSLSRALAPDASAGFVDVVAGRVALADAIWRDPVTNMAFLPAGSKAGAPCAADVLTSDAAKSLFDTLRTEFDYLIVDLAPLVANVDVRATSGLIDSYILVIEWGATRIDTVQYALRNAPGVHANIVGAVLNKVDMTVMKGYDSYSANYYYGQARAS
jgi:succinoglycan biosynthesis transport protein ExoP